MQAHYVGPMLCGSVAEPSAALMSRTATRGIGWFSEVGVPINGLFIRRSESQFLQDGA
jgi:hypothetical protein